MYCFEVANSNQSGIYLDFMQERYYFQIEYVILRLWTLPRIFSLVVTFLNVNILRHY